MSSKKMGLRRVGIVGLSTLVAASMMTLNAGTAQADWAGAGGQIGLVDANTAAAGTQGATLVYPNVNGQALGSVRLLIPNTFKSGDTIDLTVFDRTAVANNAGLINADPAHKLGFTSAPTVTVTATPYVTATVITATSPGAGGGVENTPVADTATTKATTPPVFTTTLVSSSRAAGIGVKDIIRMTVGNLGAGDAADKWIVSVSGLKADLGATVSPGELRVVPFAYNGAPNTTSSNYSTLFGNNPDVDGNVATFDPLILTYTVPAYVSPVNFGIGAPSNIVADNTTQTVGDITISETNNYSLQAGTYVVTVGGGAVIKNTTGSPSPVVVTATNAATGETVSSPAIVGHGPETLTFTLTQTDAAAANAGKLTLKLSGLLLATGVKGPISYALSGGSVTVFMATPAGSSAAIVSAGIAADSAFSAGVWQQDIAAPKLDVAGVATPIAFRIGGIDRYQTAEKIALAGSKEQPIVILASGQNFPDALSSAYLAGTLGASILLTRTTSLPASTVEGMRILGVQTVYIIGGTGAISAGVEAQLRATSQYYPGGTVTIGQGKLQVVRLGGLDRYATNKIVNLRAAAMSTDANPVGRTTIKFGQASKLTALVATGAVFADALSAGAATAGNGSGRLPIILTRPASLDPNASSQMTALGIQQAVVLGETGAVSAGVATSITGLGAAVLRIGGATRYETATMIADFEIAAAVPAATVDGGLGFNDDTEAGHHVYLARGDDFADALAGGPLAAGQLSPILLTAPTTLSPATATWLTANHAAYDYVTALGLGGAVSAAVLDAANAAVSG